MRLKELRVLSMMVFLVLAVGEEYGRKELEERMQTTKDFYPSLEKKDGKTFISMRVGTTTEKYTTDEIAPGTLLAADNVVLSANDCLYLKMIVPDDLENKTYNFEVKINGVVIHKRSGVTNGFGRRSFFIPLPSVVSDTEKPCAITLMNSDSAPLYVEKMSVLRDFDAWVRGKDFRDEFILGLLVHFRDMEKNRSDTIMDLREAPGVKKAFSSEIHYARLDDAGLQEFADTARKYVEKYGIPFLAATASWWAGTPREVFERLEFQQICFSETDTHDSGEDLKTLLGDKWDMRYGLTTPNRWSSVPWRTMNNDELNKMCEERMAKAMKKLEQELGEDVIAYVSENEPAYWAGNFPDEKYPVKRENLWADFNPHTVADAKKDGIDLDPTDGLDLEERIWLHYNVANYNQGNIDVMNESVKNKLIYSHSLLGHKFFPLDGTGHFRPYADAAKVNDAIIGIESLWYVAMDALWRVREWGLWGCVNREECDGMAMQYHVAMLQAHYMLGANMLNSYNWSGINEGNRAIGYFNEFLDNLREEDGIILAGEAGGESEWLKMTEWQQEMEVKEHFPWSTCIQLKARADEDSGLLRVWLAKEEDNSILAYRVCSAEDITADNTLTVEFGDLTIVEQKEPITLHIEAESGWQLSGDADGVHYTMMCNSSMERKRAEYIINGNEDVEEERIVLQP